MGSLSQQTCNISETGQDRTKVTINDHRKSHTRFRLVPKSTTLDNLEGPLHRVSKHVRLSEPTTKISMKIDCTLSDDDVAQ